MDTLPHRRYLSRPSRHTGCPRAPARGSQSPLRLVREGVLGGGGGWGAGFVDSLELSGTRGQEPGGSGVGEIPALAPTGWVALGRWPNRPVRWGRREGCAVGEHAAPVPGEATRRAAPPAAVPPGVRRPLAAASPVTHGRPGLAPGRRVCPGCTRPDSGQVSVGVHSCTTTPGPRGGAGRVPMASGAPPRPTPPPPRRCPGGVSPHSVLHTDTHPVWPTGHLERGHGGSPAQ